MDNNTFNLIYSILQPDNKDIVSGFCSKYKEDMYSILSIAKDFPNEKLKRVVSFISENDKDFKFFKRFCCIEDLTGKTILYIPKIPLNIEISLIPYLINLASKASKLIYVINPDFKIRKFIEYNAIEEYHAENIEFVIEKNYENVITNYNFDYILSAMDAVVLKGFENRNGLLGVGEESIEIFRYNFNIDKTKINIGLCWTEMPYSEPSVEQFYPLSEIDGVKLHSLQYHESYKSFKNGIISNLGKFCNNIYDVAVAMSAMDIVISADTEILALAEVLGKERILLDSFEGTENLVTEVKERIQNLKTL